MVFHPFGNETTLPAAAWHPEPRSRGSFSILSTSLLTLFLCVYTVVHTNVPEYEEDRRRQQPNIFKQWACRLVAPSRWRRLGWMVLAILAPEMVAWNAFEQRRKVKRTTTKVRQYIGDQWTDTHSWFAVMGGFAFDISNAPELFFPDDRRRLTITHNGIEELARTWPQLLLSDSVTCDQIKDKSKADNLAKVLACWQAAWFCAQCIFRLSSGLSISLLELNVFGHAVCALLIYIVWWDKPQDVTEPHVIASDDAFGAAAALCTFSPIGMLSEDVGMHFTGYSLALSQSHEAAIELSGPASFSEALWPLLDGQRKLTFKIGDACWTLDWKDTSFSDCLTCDEGAFLRLKYSTEPFQKQLTLVRARSHDWTITLSDFDFNSEPVKALYYLLAITLASGISGGLHMVAFWAPFPSPVQQLLWRISSLTVVAFGAVFSVFWVVSLYIVAHSTPDYPAFVMLSCGCLMMLFYFLCRTTLVVECFISLAYLSESQLALPSWSSYVPHIA